jgi:ATP-dependent Zn protease
LIIEAETTAKDILTRYRDVLDTLAEALIKEEVLEKDDIERIIRDTKVKTETGNPEP